MADIGRSTATHQDSIGDVALLYAETHKKLRGWGDWHASLPGAGSTTSPMFRNMKTGYRESRGRRLDYDEKDAAVMDQVIASYCTSFEKRHLFSHFVYQQSSRSFARELEKEGAVSGDKPINVHHVLKLLDSTIARIDIALSLGSA